MDRADVWVMMKGVDRSLEASFALADGLSVALGRVIVTPSP
ncbi:MAG: hypothetical protein JW394_0244 [Nitrospira sp.]|nr:hypothetical protein [Nitrospira sp.]